MPRSEGYRIERLASIGYDEIGALLTKLRRCSDFHFQGFGDWPAAEVAARTGLDESTAQVAKQRTAPQPVPWLPSAPASS